jgi:son of sevenless-like protein
LLCCLDKDKRAPEIIEDIKLNPKVILPKAVALKNMKEHLYSNPKNLMDIDPLEIARQVTIYEFRIWREIKPKECLDQGWEKSDKLVRSPNISAMIKNTNNITLWVATRIVETVEMKPRLAVIKYFVSVAAHCRELRNFNATVNSHYFLL